MIFKEFYTCPNCGMAISGEKKEFFVCQNCGSALCRKENLKDFKNNYCGNCGHSLVSAKKDALLALAEETQEQQFMAECNDIYEIQEKTQSFLENWSKSKRASFSE